MQNAAGATEVALFGLAAIAAAVYGVAFCRSETPAGTVFKTASVLLLAAFAGLWGAPDLLVLALALSSLGDFFLSRPGDRAFLAGMAAFLAAHLAYIAFFIPRAGPMLQSAADGAALALMLGFGGGIYRLIYPGLGAFKVPVAVYILAILGMGWFALHLDRHQIDGFAASLVMTGAGLFLLSDTVLGVQKFRLRAGTGADQVASYLVWSTYWVAQALIAISGGGLGR